MANNLNQEQKVDTKAVLKCENAEQVRTSWQGAFNTLPPSPQAIYQEISESTRSVVNLPKSGRLKTSMTEENETRMAFDICEVQKSPQDTLQWNYPYQEHPCDT